MKSIAHWLRSANHVEAFIGIGIGVLMVAFPDANSFRHPILSVSIGFLFIWLGILLLNRNASAEIFFTSVIVRAVHTSFVAHELLSNMWWGRLIAVVIYVGSILYAISKKLDELEDEKHAAN